MRTKDEFEKYVIEKSRKKLEEKKVRKKMLTTVASIFIVSLGVFTVISSNESFNDSASNSPTNTVSVENNTDSIYDNNNSTISASSSTFINGDIPSSVTNNYYNDNIYNDSIENVSQEIAKDNDKALNQNTSSFTANSIYNCSSPDTITVSENGNIANEITDNDTIKELYNNTIELVRSESEKSVSSPKAYTITFIYHNSENIVIDILDNSVNVNGECTVPLSEEYLNIIKNLTA